MDEQATVTKEAGACVKTGSCYPYTKFTPGNIFMDGSGQRVIVIGAPHDKRMIVDYWTAQVLQIGGMHILDHNQLVSRLHGYTWQGTHEEALNTMISHEARK